MTTRGEINSNFYQIVNVDANGAPTSVKAAYLPNVGNANYAANAGHANVADTANLVAVANVSGIGNIATVNLTGSTSNVLFGNGTFAAIPAAANANYANYANYANIAHTANSVSVANVSGIGNIATVNLNGNGSQALLGNGTWGNVTGGGGTPGGSNSQLQYNNDGNFAGTSQLVISSGGSLDIALASDGSSTSYPLVLAGNPFPSNPGYNRLTSATALGGQGIYGTPTGVLTANFFAGDGNQISNIAGANITGYVPNATHANVSDSANSVAVANVTGIGNIATVNLDGSTTNVLYGNGTFAAIPTVSNVANANFANFAGTAYSVSGSNVSGEVANANYATYSGSSNTAITVTSSNQPNITTVGTLTSLNVTGNILSYANISGGYIFGDGSYLTGIGNLSAARGYWGSFYSNVTQSIASTTTAYPVTLNNTDPDSYGTYISSNSHINFQFAGTYNLQFSAQFLNTDPSIVEASVWLRKNGVDVIDTRGACAITSKQGSVNGQIIESWNYIIKLAAGDYLELVWQAESTNVSMEYLPAGTTPTSPASPSIIVTVQQVTNVQPVELQGSMTGNIIGNGFSLINIASISSLDGITGNTFTGNGAPLTNLTGANVTGYVANATHANIADNANVAYSVSGANVSGDVAGANHANVADSANSVAGANVSGAVAFATTANSVAGANVSGTVANATYATTAGTADSVAGANVSGQVANALVAGTVYTAAQPNITSTGTLTSLTVSGNVDAQSVMFVGPGASSTSFTNPAFIAKNSGANYIQAAIINTNTTGSSDWIAYGDNSTDLNAWSDMGFTSSSFNDPAYTITQPNDGYFFVQGDGANVNGGSLVIATGNQGATKDIVFGTGGFLEDNEKMRFIHAAGQFYIQPNTTATSTSTGALRVVGGVGIGGAAYIGADLNVAGQSNLGPVTNVHITGGTTGQVLTTDGSGNLSWATGGGGGGSVAGSNTQVQFNDAGAFGASANLTFDKTTNTLSATNITGNGSGLTSLTGANVTGEVPYAAVANSVAGSNVSGQVSYAAVANSVAVANVSGIGNIATVNLTGSTSNVLYGNGTFAAVTSVANATAANTVLSNTSSATTAYPTFFTSSANGYATPVKVSSISANLANASIAATSFVGNLTGTAANATSANTASNIAITGDTSNTSTQYITFVGVSTSNASTQLKNDTGLQYVPANNAITGSAGMQFDGDLVGSNGNSTTNTSKVTVGSATGDITLTVAGTVRANVNTSGLNVTGTLSVAGNVQASRYISNVTTGIAPLTVTSTTQVANLNVARAGTADSVAVANVTGIGNIATVNLTGSTSNVLYGNGVFAAISVTSVANANYSNFAGTAYSVDAANIVGTVNLANYATVANSVAVGNVSGIGNIATVNLDGSSSNVLYGNGVWAAGGGGGGSPGGSNTQLQFNNSGSFGGISTVTYDGSNISLGAVGNVKITGGASNDVLRTDGTGNLTFNSIAESLLVGTRAGPYTVPINNYTFQVTSRTGNVTVYVN